MAKPVPVSGPCSFSNSQHGISTPATWRIVRAPRYERHAGRLVCDRCLLDPASWTGTGLETERLSDGLLRTTLAGYEPAPALVAAVTSDITLTLDALLPLIERLRPLVPALAARWAPVFALMDWHQDHNRPPSIPELARSMDRMIDDLARHADGTVHGTSGTRGHVCVYVHQDCETHVFYAGIELVGERREA